MQSPGSAFIFVTNLAPPPIPFKDYVTGTVWIRNSQVFTYRNAPTITSVSPNYVRCDRNPILISPGTNYTHVCESLAIDVNGCGYDLSNTIASYCSFFGSSTLAGNRIQNAPFFLGKANTDQQIRCMSPKGTDQLRRDCAQFQNATFRIGSRDFAIAQSTSASSSASVCTSDADWFPLPADTQVKFTFYDNPAFLKLTELNLNDRFSSRTLSLDFLRVSDSVPGYFFVALPIFFHTFFYQHCFF
jgi:hypothetical protein